MMSISMGLVGMKCMCTTIGNTRVIRVKGNPLKKNPSVREKISHVKRIIRIMYSEVI